MAVNRGVAPPVRGTEVGDFRFLIGDAAYEELTPPEAGYGSYKLFSDEEIEVFLSMGTSPEDAAYLAYMQLAGAAALSSSSIQDYDLKVSTEKRATDLRLIAQGWKDRADAAAADIFELFDVSIRDEDCPPELAPWPVRRNCGVRLF